MTNLPRYLLARYIPDLMRQEPHNYGVVVWTPQGVGARFLGEDAENPGKVDGRKIPQFVQDPAVYKSWVKFLREEIEGSFLFPVKGGSPVAKEDLNYLDVLATAGRGNYILEPCGRVLNDVPEDEINQMIDYIFERLVGPISPEKAPSKQAPISVKRLCNSLISAAGLKDDPNFKKNEKINIGKGSDLEELPLDYVYKNGALRAAFERVSLLNHSQDHGDVYAAAFKLEVLSHSQLLSPDFFGVLAAYNENDLTSNEEQLIHTLQKRGPVHNLLDAQVREGVERRLRDLSLSHR